MKISLEDWTRIGKYNPAREWLRPFCSYSLKVEPNGRYKREQRIGWFIYIPLLIPVCILQAICCMWDGGLKEFEFPKRYLGGDWIYPDTEPGRIAKEIYERA